MKWWNCIAIFSINLCEIWVSKNILTIYIDVLVPTFIIIGCKIWKSLQRNEEINSNVFHTSVDGNLDKHQIFWAVHVIQILMASNCK